MKEMVGGCCVCSDERGWPENPLVYCDGQNCTVAVHQACYGIVTVPTGPWYCRKCESQERPARVRCELCPSRDGALKRTDNLGWAHVVCALYIPEVRFGNVTTMEPIILQLIPSERYAKTCYICQEIGKPNRANVGACMQCNKFNCKQQFHVTCAQSLGLLCEEAGNYLDNVKYCGYCQHHYSKLKKGGNVKTIPPYKPITHDSSGSDSGSSPEKEVDLTVSATASSTSATSIKIITNAIGTSGASNSGSVALSSTKQRKSSTTSKQSHLPSSTSSAGVASGIPTNLSGNIASTTANSGPNSLVVSSNSSESVTNSGGTNPIINLNVSGSKSNNINSGSAKEKEKHSKNLSKVASSKDKEKDKELPATSSLSSSTREKGNKSKNKDIGEYSSGGVGVAVADIGLASGSGQNPTNLAIRTGIGIDCSSGSTDNVFQTEAISQPLSSNMQMKGGLLTKKRKADSKAGIFADAMDINQSFRDIIKDVTVTLTPLMLDKTSDVGEVEKIKKQKTELSPPIHQSTEPSNLTAANITPLESSTSISPIPSLTSAPNNKPGKERDERLRSSSPYTTTVSSAGVAVTAGSTSGGPSLYVSVPLSTANVPGLNLPTSMEDHATPSHSTRAAIQQQQQTQTTSVVIERQSPRIHNQLPSSPVGSEHGSFSSSLPSPAHPSILQSGKPPSPSITGGNLTATTTESGNLKISYEKQNLRVAQLQEQESAPMRRSRSRSGEHSTSMVPKPRFGKKRSAAASNTPLAKSSSSSSLPASASEQLQQQQQQKQFAPLVTLTNVAHDIFSESSEKSQPILSVSLLAAPIPQKIISSPKNTDNDTIGNNTSVNSKYNAVNLTTSSPLTPPPPSISSTSSCSTVSTSSSSTPSNLNSTSSNSSQTNASSVKNINCKSNISESVSNTMGAVITNSHKNICNPTTLSPPVSTPTTPAAAVGSNVGSCKPLNKKLLRAQQTHYLQQQQHQQLAAIQQQQASAVSKALDGTASTALSTSLPIDESNSNTNPTPPTISRTPDSGIFSAFNISGNSQSLLPGATPSVNGGLKISYEAQPGIPLASTSQTINTSLATNAAIKDSPPSSPNSENGSTRKRGRKSNEIKETKIFQNGGCAVSTPVTTPTPISSSNGPMHATHMLGNQLNPTSSVAQKLTDQLHMEMQDHSVYTEPQPAQFVGVPLPSKPFNNVRNPSNMPNSANSLASMFGGNGGGYAPQSLEQLLERQWEQGSQFLMEQAQHFDIASLLSCLHQLQTENVRLEEHVNSLIARRDHLLAVNARLAIPLNANVPQSQVNLSNIHLNAPTQSEVAATSATASTLSAPTISSANVSSAVTIPSSGRATRLTAPPTAMENGIDFRHSTTLQLSAQAQVPASTSAQGNSSSRTASSIHPNVTLTTNSLSTSHHTHQYHQNQQQQHQHHQQQQHSLTQHSTLASSACNLNSALTSLSRQTQQQPQPPPSHNQAQSSHNQTQQPHQSQHSQHHSHHTQHQQQLHNPHQSHSLAQQHSLHPHHSSSTGTIAAHLMQQQPISHPVMTLPLSDGSVRTAGLSSNSSGSRSGNSIGSGIGNSQLLPGRSGHNDNSPYHPVYSHQSQLRRDGSQGKTS